MKLNCLNWCLILSTFSLAFLLLLAICIRGSWTHTHSLRSERQSEEASVKKGSVSRQTSDLDEIPKTYKKGSTKIEFTSCLKAGWNAPIAPLSPTLVDRLKEGKCRILQKLTLNFRRRRGPPIKGLYTPAEATKYENPFAATIMKADLSLQVAFLCLRTQNGADCQLM